MVEDFIQGCKRIGGTLLFSNSLCNRRVQFTNRKGQRVERVVQVRESKFGRGGAVVTEGSAFDSGFDTDIFVENLEPASDRITLPSFDLAKEIIDAEGNPKRMQDIIQNLGDAYVLDPSDPEDGEIARGLI